MADRDFLVDDKGEMIIRNGTFATGESLTQEVALLLITNQGEIRNDMFCGCNLVERTNSRITRSELERIIRLQVQRDGKDYSRLKRGINVRVNG